MQKEDRAQAMKVKIDVARRHRYYESHQPIAHAIKHFRHKPYSMMIDKGGEVLDREAISDADSYFDDESITD